MARGLDRLDHVVRGLLYEQSSRNAAKAALLVLLGVGYLIYNWLRTTTAAWASLARTSSLLISTMALTWAAHRFWHTTLHPQPFPERSRRAFC